MTTIGATFRERIEGIPHDPRDPDPWLALYLDRSIPMDEEAKAALLLTTRSRSRQFLLPIVRPLARLTMMLLQLWKTLVPRWFTSSRLLHRSIHHGLRVFVAPEANFLILRHFHIGSEVLAFVARNAPVAVPTSPLRPERLSELERDEVFLNHDLNLFNFVIRLNHSLRAERRELLAPDRVDFQDITDGPFPMQALPTGWLNVIDAQTAIEIYTPLYQLFLSDSDFWRATNSLQLDETIGIYAARILRSPEHLVLLNNKHPLVPLVTHGAGLRLMLHGLSSEALHALLREGKRRAAAAP